MSLHTQPHFPLRSLQGELTIEPPGVVLIRAHGCLLPKRAENGCISAHKIDVHACVELLICRSVGGSVRALLRLRDRWVKFVMFHPPKHSPPAL